MRILTAGALACLAFAASAEADATRERELVRLVRQDCGSCHGMNLTGGLGLPLTPEALRDKPFDSLVATVVYGRPGTAMPPWKSIISERDAEWIVRQLIQGFPLETR
jgi:cytochrome c55X